MCRSWKFWGLIALLAAAVVVAAPGLRATLVPLLLVAACPLSMVFMAVSMGRQRRRATDGERDEVSPPVSSR